MTQNLKLQVARKTINAIISNEEYYKRLNIEELKRFVVYASDKYYNEEPIISDERFDDILDHIKQRDEDFVIVGAPIQNSNKKKLPVWMGSMNKKKVNSLLDKYTNIVVADKLDGVSCLYVRKNNKISLFTRGNGEYGSDITHLLSHFNFIDESEGEDIILRGELIMKKDIFNKLRISESNPRNTVSGFVNSKYPNIKYNKSIDFVVYEVIEPAANKLSLQYESLKTSKFKTVHYSVWNDITNRTIHTMLQERKGLSVYEIDGIIITSDIEYKRITSGNPKHAFAYKHNFNENKQESVVTNIVWNVSKDRYLKPTVHFAEVVIDNVKISSATGFNAKFINDNNIGKDTIVVIERSGDVIPHIVSVTKSTKADMPDTSYLWNKSKIDIYVPEDNTDVKARLFQNLIEKLDFKSFGTKTVDKFYKLGYTNLNKIFNLSVDEIKSIDGFSDVSAKKLYSNIRERRKSLKCVDYMQASNVFGRGFSNKRLELILKKYPTLDHTDINVEELIMIDGVGKIIAEQYKKGLEKFAKFISDNLIECNLVIRDKSSEQTICNEKITNKTIVFSGFRDEKVSEVIEKNGGVIQDTVSNSTDILVVKSKDIISSKTKKAYKLGIEIYTIDEFKKIL